MLLRPHDPPLVNLEDDVAGGRAVVPAAGLRRTKQERDCQAGGHEERTAEPVLAARNRETEDP